MVAAMLLAGGCQGLKEDLGIGVKRAPDEFRTYSRAPLSVPPDFALRPPATATGAEPTSAGGSPGLQALLDRTGAATAQADIRAQVNRESTILAEADQSFVQRLMFWSDTPEPASVVDARQESRRIQENQALNNSLTAGQTPTIRRKPKALLEGIF